MSNSTVIPSLPTPVPLDLSNTFGALLIGSFFGCILWGAQAVQTVWYYLSFPNDPLHTKILVAVLNAVSSLDIVFEILSIWVGAIKNSGTPPNVFTNRYLFYRIPTFSVVALLTQCFFLLRIFRFANINVIKIGIPILLLPLIVFQLIGNSIVTANWLGANPGSDPLSAEIAVQTKNSRFIIPLYGAACASDMMIAIVMCGLLFERRTGLIKTDRLLLNLAVTSINTGIWPALLALLICILTRVTSPADFIFAAPNYAASSLYVNTVLCNLNVRQFFRNQEFETSKKTPFVASVMKWRDWTTSGSSGSSGRENTTKLGAGRVPHVAIEQTTHQEDRGVYELRVKASSTSMAYDDAVASSRAYGSLGTIDTKVIHSHHDLESQEGA